MTDTCKPLASVLGKIVADECVPKGTIYAILPRRITAGGDPESLEEWAKRCFYIVNIGEGVD